MNTKQLTPKQKKAVWIVGIVLVALHFLPSFVATVRNQFSHSTHSVVAVPHQPVAPPVASLPATPPPLAVDPFAALYVGRFEGQQLLPDLSKCITTLEVKPAIAKAGFYSGYASMACVPSPIFYKGPLTAARKGETGNIIAAAEPVYSSMTGSITDGDLAFRIDQVVGATPLHCGPSTFALSNWGSGQVMAQYEEALPCKGSVHMILVKKRA